MNPHKLRFNLWMLSHFKIPMIGICRPTLLEINPERIVVRIPLYFFTKNHYGSMYFGAQAVGADLAAGYLGYAICEEQNLHSGLVFKDMKAEFLKRPESDVYFVCTEGQAIQHQIRQSLTTGSRVTQAIAVNAYIHYNEDNQELVSGFVLGLSLKVKKQSTK